MEVQPRLRTTPQPGATLHNPAVPGASAAENLKQVPGSPKAQLKKSKETKESKEVLQDQSDTEEPQFEKQKSFFRDNMTLIIIFAVVIIVLIVVIIWLMGKNDKYLGWLRGSKPPPMRQPMHASGPGGPTHMQAPPSAPPAAHPPKLTHQDVVNSVSADELAKFANLEIDSKPSKAQIEEITETDKVEVVVEQPKEQKVAPSSPPANIAKPDCPEHVIDLGAETERRLNAKLDALEALELDIEASSASTDTAIDEAVNAEVAKIEAEQNRPVEQFNLKTGVTVAIFNDRDELYKANFDPEQVTAVCRGDQKSHKKYGWRYHTSS